MQALTIQVQIFPSREEQALLRQLADEYIRVVNTLAEQAVTNGLFPKITTKDVDAFLPSAVLNQAIRDAKSVYRKSKKLGKRPVLKKRVYFVNNQNYSIGEDFIAFPVVVGGKTKRVAFHAQWTERHKKMLSNAKLGLLRIVEKSHRWYAQIALEVETPPERETGNTMGVDLGLKCPAVAVTSTGKTRFFGNGRMIKYIRRKYQSRRRKLGKLKKLAAIRKLGNKEHRWMTDQNHKISKQIINLAVQEGVSTIKLEKLANIRKTARTSRKNAKNLHNWPFYQLAMFISYKAKLAGIRMVFVDPAYTSQSCPKCGTRNKARDRRYACHACGYVTHRDRVGAMNILQAVADGVAASP